MALKVTSVVSCSLVTESARFNCAANDIKIKYHICHFSLDYSWCNKQYYSLLDYMRFKEK